MAALAQVTFRSVIHRISTKNVSSLSEILFSNFREFRVFTTLHIPHTYNAVP